MKKILLAGAAFAAMTSVAMADPSSTDALIGTAAHNAVALSNTEMSAISGGVISPSVNVIVQTPIAVQTNISVLSENVLQQNFAYLRTTASIRSR